ncbi:MAG: hypothetical protein GAK37_03586 [Pseudomonas sp.]|nr:MAG: hypothetical protein GAK37_03586 [Pseudomonas sp.]
MPTPQYLTPGTWLARHSLQPDERLFVVLGNASAAKPFDAWRGLASGVLPQPVWAGTAYAEWGEVMPYVGIIEPHSPFLDWIATTEATDWGWLAVSSSPLEQVIAQLNSLTKVLLPDGQAVFLRFWDGAHFLSVLQALAEEVGDVLPVFQRYLINGRLLAVAPRPVGEAKTSPWWRVPPHVLEHLAEQSPQTLSDNLLQWLEEQHPQLHAAFSPVTLKHKVVYFARNARGDQQALAAWLTSETGVPLAAT